MNQLAYRYTLSKHVPLAEVSDSLFIAAFSAECIHGRAEMCLNARFWLDDKKRECLIDASTPIGETIAKIFTGYLDHEFEEDAYAITRALVSEADFNPKRADERKDSRKTSQAARAS